MKHISRIIIGIVLSLALLLASMAGMAAAKKAPPKKAPAKTPPKRVVLGTKQLDGNQAQPGLTYTLGKTDPINVTVDKIEYTVEPIRFGHTVIAPNADEKLLVLHYTLHNCNRTPRGLAWSTLKFTAVDSNDTNWSYVGDVAMEATGETCSMSLKPAQKTKVYTAIKVPAKAVIPKIMIQSGDNLVLRYDIRGKFVKLPAHIADPADPTGATALEKVPVKMGTYYTFKELQAKIDSAEFSSEPFKNEAPRQGKRYLIVKGSIKNNLLENRGIAWSTFKPKVTDIDGGEIEWTGDIYFASRDDSLHGTIEPGQEMRFRWIFNAPDKVGLQSLAVNENGGRSFVYDLSAVQ